MQRAPLHPEVAPLSKRHWVKATGVMDGHVRWTEVTRINFITVHTFWAGRTASASSYGTVPLIYRCYLTMPDHR